ncbi:ABC transporter ATP-binding protein [Qipengyuania zhejiangensis]|uniref:ABC transporter ATP-binding protein n=1 Tax=Qipengyuania zhejiangensis TaxID=3077782 RepID=UPI002D76D3A3|nr:ATP-binding cassette domain-containing protein [Qipengyuania sp. Z2]
MPVLQVENLVKRFDNFLAVDDLSFSVKEGEIFGFLGGNGAGKTTTLRMMLDIIRPTSGHIEVLGSTPDRRNAAAIGFLPEERGLYSNMKAIDAIVYFGRLKEMDPGDARQHGMELLERFELADRAKSNIGDMSKGMAQKVQLACSLVNRPQLLMLDEPFSGLDPVNQGLLEDEILRASRRGAAVIFSTHVMQHAERLCDRLLLLRRGSKRFEGTLDEARASLPARITATARPQIAAVRGVARADALEDLGDGWTRYDLQLVPGVSAADVLETCTTQAIALRQFEEHRASLHDVFVQMVGDEGVEQ